MKETHLFALRYRAGIKGAITGQIQATSLDRAQAIGRQWCAEHPGNIFLEVYDPMLAWEDSAGAVHGINDLQALGFGDARSAATQPEAPVGKSR